MLGRRKLWGIYIGQFCLTSTLWFFLTWFPTYLVTYRHMDYIKTGFLTSLPFIAALAGVLISGVLSDYMLKRGVSLGTSRKLPIITGLLLSMSMIGAIFTDSTALVITFMFIAFFGNGLASITWSLVSSALAPSRLIGLTGGMFNFIGQPVLDCHPDRDWLAGLGDRFRSSLHLHDGHCGSWHPVLCLLGRSGTARRRIVIRLNIFRDDVSFSTWESKRGLFCVYTSLSKYGLLWGNFDRIHLLTLLRSLKIVLRARYDRK